MSPTADPTLRGQLRRAIERAWAAAIAAGALPSIGPDDGAPQVTVERPSNPDHGDAATSLALKLARPYRRPPLDIARAIAAELAREASADPASTPVGSVDVAPPGFINVRYSDQALAATVGSILAEPADVGSGAREQPRAA